MKLNSFVIIASFALLTISFWQRNELPQNVEVLPQTKSEPIQKTTRKRPFEASFNGVSYTIEPQYEYDITGMVVSFRHHEGNSRMHRQSNDHLNMLDVCVVWGDNAGNPALSKLDFWNGIFTCLVKTRDSDAWAAFNIEQLSNNHLISDDDLIRKRVREISIGDQIRVRGYLSSYGNESGGKRGTSTTRLDTGDGACETIYVERFEILHSSLSAWRVSMYTSAAVLLLALFFHFRQPYRPHAKRS